MKKRLTAFLLTIVLCLSLAGSAFAAGAEFEPAEYNGGTVTITAEAGSTEAVIYMEGLTAGRTYYGWSLMLIRDGESTPVTTYNPKAGTLEAGGGYWKKTVKNLPELKNGDILRLNMPDIGMYYQETVGKETCTVTFDANGGTLKGSASVEVEKGRTVAKPADPGRSGYTFTGWTTDKDGRNAFDFSTPITADITLYAQWKKQPATPTQPEKPGSETPSVPGSSGSGSGSRDDRDDDDDDGRPVTVKRPAHGSVSYSPSTPGKGTVVTVTVRPDDGYELASLTVRRSGGSTVAVTKVSETEYTFVMPAGSVIIEAVFRVKPAEPSVPSFPDVPAGYTFYGDITWAASRGYMAGYGDGTFRPTANTTRQVLWMVLGRMAGAAPADMSAARAWAMQSGVSDGTNAAGGMTRQQMVTMLYRYAQQRGCTISGSADLSKYPDGAGVAEYAREAMSWAVANGIVQGTADGRLNPGGVATRAHFAAFLHRFCQTVGIA